MTGYTLLFNQKNYEINPKQLKNTNHKSFIGLHQKLFYQKQFYSFKNKL